jgi:hypothetical protein
MKSDRNHRPNGTAGELAAIISNYRASGLGLKAFAREQGLSPGRLHYWLYQKQPCGCSSRRTKPTKVAGAPIFQEVKLTTGMPPAGSWAAEISLPRGLAVRFSPAATAEWIGAVVQALQRPC